MNTSMSISFTATCTKHYNKGQESELNHLLVNMHFITPDETHDVLKCMCKQM